MERLLYSREIGDIASLVIIDGNIVKNRGNLYNFNNVVFQIKNKISIYCEDENCYRMYKKIIDNLKLNFDKDKVIKNIKLYKII